MGYETGYIDRHIKNLRVKEDIKQIFEGKKATGVCACGAMHKTENYVLPSELDSSFVNKLESVCKAHSAYILSKNSIPVCYDQSEYPIAIFGENARYAEADDIKTERLLIPVRHKF